jgi:hypothetical protein
MFQKISEVESAARALCAFYVHYAVEYTKLRVA